MIFFGHSALGLMMSHDWKLTSILSVVADLVTVCLFLYATMGVYFMEMITVFVWCGTALRV